MFPQRSSQRRVDVASSGLNSRSQGAVRPGYPSPWWMALLVLLSLALILPAVAAGDDEIPSAKEMRLLLKQAALSGDPASLAEVMRRLGKIPGRDPAKVVLTSAASLGKGNDDLYWFLIEGVAAFQGPEAHTEMGEYIVRNKGHAVSRDLLNALRKNHCKYVNRVIRRVLAKAPLELQLMAVDIAAEVPVRRTVDVLLPVLRREYDKEREGRKPPTELKKRILLALEALTLNQLNSVINWEGWWKVNRQKGLAVIREESEHEIPTTSLARPLDPVRARQFLGLEELPPGKVLVIKGQRAKNGHDINFDHIENTLSQLRVPHEVVTKDEFEKKSFKVSGFAAILINCTQINPFCQSPGHTAGAYTGKRLHRCMGPEPHDIAEYKFGQDALDKLKRWVERGGFLFTEDWVLTEVLQLIFPKKVTAGDPLSGGQVGIRPKRGMTAHPLLRGVFVPPVKFSRDWDYDEDDDLDEEGEYDPASEDDPEDVDERSGTAVGGDKAGEKDEPIPDPEITGIRHQWEIDKESPSLEIRSKSVEVLINSEELEDQCGNGAVAISFTAKQGKVLHVLSHFGKQGSAHDEATIENLLVNFLIEVKIRVDRTSGSR